MARLTGLVLAVAGATPGQAYAQSTNAPAFTLSPVASDQLDDPFQVVTMFEGLNTLGLAVENLNRALALPTVVEVSLASCPGPEAFYDPAGNKIVICVEFVEAVLQFELDQIDALGSLLGDETAAYIWGQVSDQVVFVIHHEAGHAAIHQLDLPVTGRVEDAADQLAFLLLGADPGMRITGVTAGVQLLNHFSSSESLDATSAGGVHAFSLERGATLICMMYGSHQSDPGAWPGFWREAVVEWAVERLPATRRAQCQEEYEVAFRSWRRLLGRALLIG